MKFVLLITGEDKWAELSPEEMQAGLERYQAFAQRLRDEGRMVDAEGLDGKRVKIDAQRIASDGPFAETREMVGGYYIYTAADWDEAIEIAKACPSYDYGGTVELRAVQQYS